MILKLHNETCPPPFSRFGGKGATVQWYRALLPPHITYVEPCCGSAALLFAKSRSKVEVINDLDSDIYNFFKVLRDPQKSAILADLIHKTPYSREEFERCQELRTTVLEEVEKARVFYVLCRQSFGSLHGKCWAYGRVSMKSFHSSLAEFEPLCQRLQQVEVENLPALTVIEKYDAPGTVFFIDPPYLPETRVRKDGYLHEMDKLQHEELLQRLLRVKGKVILCGYPSDLYDSVLLGWQRIERPVKCCTGALIDGVASRPVKTEVVWMKLDND